MLREVPSNDENTSVEEITRQLLEKRLLPVGMEEFEIWTDRIISGIGLTATPESMKFALAEMLLHLSPTTDSECDGYFIKALRKSAINQIAVAKKKEIQDLAKARLKAQQQEKTQGEVTAETSSESQNGEPPAES